jgi:hypothetical protein
MPIVTKRNKTQTNPQETHSTTGSVLQLQSQPTDTVMITYRELLQQLQQFTDGQLDSNVTIYD